MRGFQQSLIFHIKTLMVDKNVVKSLVDEWLEGKEYFLVDIQISPDDKIVVEIDHADGFIGKEVEVLDKDGKKVKGVLKSVDGNDFVVAVNEKVHVEGKKRPVKMDVDHTYKMDEVKYTKYIISFK